MQTKRTPRIAFNQPGKLIAQLTPPWSRLCFAMVYARAGMALVLIGRTARAGLFGKGNFVRQV